MTPIFVDDIHDKRLDVFARLTEAQLRNRLDPSRGVFIAESPKVIRIALAKAYEPVALLAEAKHLDGDAADIVRACGEIPVYTGPRDMLASLTGYVLTRGVLCAMRRKEQPSLQSVCCGADRIAVIYGVVDSTNIGAIFRSAAALGIDGIALTMTSCDPLNRRAVRVSMGTVFQVPWTWIESPSQLRPMGFKTVALALTERSVPIDDVDLNRERRLAIVLGTEGDGLSDAVIGDADYVARIPMCHGVDSLNVAAASAVAFWQLRGRK